MSFKAPFVSLTGKLNKSLTLSEIFLGIKKSSAGWEEDVCPGGAAEYVTVGRREPVRGFTAVCGTSEARAEERNGLAVVWGGNAGIPGDGW